MKEKTKVEMMWEVSREQEKEFRDSLPDFYDTDDLDDLFKLIRGKEDAKKEEISDKEGYLDNKDYLVELSTSKSIKCRICGMYKELHKTMNHEYESQIQTNKKDNKE